MCKLTNQQIQEIMKTKIIDFYPQMCSYIGWDFHEKHKRNVSNEIPEFLNTKTDNARNNMFIVKRPGFWMEKNTIVIRIDDFGCFDEIKYIIDIVLDDERIVGAINKQIVKLKICSVYPLIKPNILDDKRRLIEIEHGVFMKELEKYLTEKNITCYNIKQLTCTEQYIP